MIDGLTKSVEPSRPTVATVREALAVDRRADKIDANASSPLSKIQDRIVIVVRELRAGKFEARLEGSARVLLAEGYPPDALLIMRHAGREDDALRGPLGGAARLTIEESGHGPVVRSFRTAPAGAVDAPRIAPREGAATSLLGGAP